MPASRGKGKISNPHPTTQHWLYMTGLKASLHLEYFSSSMPIIFLLLKVPPKLYRPSTSHGFVSKQSHKGNLRKKLISKAMKRNLSKKFQQWGYRKSMLMGNSLLWMSKLKPLPAWYLLSVSLRVLIRIAKPKISILNPSIKFVFNMCFYWLTYSLLQTSITQAADFISSLINVALSRDVPFTNHSNYSACIMVLFPFVPSFFVQLQPRIGDNFW